MPTESQQEPGDAASRHHLSSVRAAIPPPSPSPVWELQMTLKHRGFQLLPWCTPFQILLNTTFCTQALCCFPCCRLLSWEERREGSLWADSCMDSPVKRVLQVPLPPSAETALQTILLLQPKWSLLLLPSTDGFSLYIFTLTGNFIWDLPFPFIKQTFPCLLTGVLLIWL